MQVLIYFDSNYDYKKFYRKKLITTVPAWSLYNYNGQNVFIFHPQEKEKIVAVLICISGFREVETIILDASFSRQPLPICVTALLLQGILVEREEGLILHGSVIGHNCEGMVLTGNSGVGKTTISKLIIKNSNSYQICDDRFIIKILQDKIYAYGNPFDFKIERVNNNHMELKKLYFLHHADENIVSVVPNNKKCKNY